MPGATVAPQVANEAYSITKHDTNPNIYSYIYVGTGGDVAIIPENGTSALTFKNVPSGAFLWVRTKNVMSTNTTAADMLGFR